MARDGRFEMEWVLGTGNFFGRHFWGKYQALIGQGGVTEARQLLFLRIEFLWPVTVRSLADLQP